MTPNRKYGIAVPTPVHLLEMADFDFAVPALVVTLQLPQNANQGSLKHLALDVHHLVIALSDVEKKLGGRGMRLFQRIAEEGVITLVIVPILADQPWQRLQRLMTVATEISQSKQKAATSNGSLADALERITTSATDRLKAALGCREWNAAFRIEEPQY